MTINNSSDAVCLINIGSVDYECREHIYESRVLQIADPFSVTIPAPNGKVLGSDGRQVSMMEVAKMGSPVTISMKDPNVNGESPVLKLTGLVTKRSLQTTRDGGCVLAVAGADIGWYLGSCATVFKNLQGLLWPQFLSRVCGLTVNATSNSNEWSVVTGGDQYGWGFKGVRKDNTINSSMKGGGKGAKLAKQQKETKERNTAIAVINEQNRLRRIGELGRELTNIEISQIWTPTVPMPVYQTEVGETIDEMMVKFARFDFFLINVSADGWLQIFRPNYTDPPKYKFYRYLATDPRCSMNNIQNPVLDETAETLFTRAECWTTVVNPIIHPEAVPANVADINAGRYHGSYPLKGAASSEDFTYFPKHRLHTYTDQNQMSKARADTRSKWKFSKGVFDSWTYTFSTPGHSQDGISFVEDSLCEIHDEVYGIDGTYYISDIKCTRKFASPGIDRSGTVGTKTEFTVRLKDIFKTG